MAELELEAPAGTTEAPPAAVPTWRDSLPDDLKADKSLESFKDVAGLAKSYVETKRLVGSKAELKIPDSTSTPEERAAFRKAMQVPDTPDGYTVKTHAMFTHPEWNKEAQASFLKLFHEEGVPPKTAERILHAYGDFMASQVKAVDTVNAEARGELKTEWGINHDAFMGAANSGAQRVAKALGVQPGDVFEATKGSDPALVAKMFHWMESQFTEHGWVSGEPVRGVSPEEAMGRLTELQAQLEKVPQGSDQALAIIEQITQVGAAMKRAA